MKNTAKYAGVIAIALYSSATFALTYEQKQARETPLLDCQEVVVTFAYALASHPNFDITQEGALVDRMYGLAGKYEAALVAIVRDNSGGQHTAEMTRNYLRARKSEAGDRFDSQSPEEIGSLFGHCINNEEDMLKEGIEVAEETLGYGMFAVISANAKKSYMKYLEW